jgi:hypothetical protein
LAGFQLLDFQDFPGQGKLLVCMAQLPQIMDKPEASQLYQSLINYLQSEAFDPDYAIGIEKLKEIVNKSGNSHITAA